MAKKKECDYLFGDLSKKESWELRKVMRFCKTLSRRNKSLATEAETRCFRIEGELLLRKEMEFEDAIPNSDLNLITD